jgi:hypothetical protein
MIKAVKAKDSKCLAANRPFWRYENKHAISLAAIIWLRLGRGALGPAVAPWCSSPKSGSRGQGARSGPLAWPKHAWHAQLRREQTAMRHNQQCCAGQAVRTRNALNAYFPEKPDKEEIKRS